MKKNPWPGADPRRVVIAGDWHGNTGWATSVTSQCAEVLRSEDVRFIVHCGDFGVWPQGEQYLELVQAELDSGDMYLLWIDGNHEDHAQIATWHTEGNDAAIAVPGYSRIFHLPRGWRWTWHGRTWLAVGGGVSLDRKIRTEGRDWWPQEEITGKQEAAIIAAGQADVMVSHDCPSGVVHAFPQPPSWWGLADLARNDVHRERLQRIVNATQPSHILHGHLHRHYYRERNFGYGPVKVTGFDCDGAAGNWAVLDVASMTFDAGAAAL